MAYIIAAEDKGGTGTYYLTLTTQAGELDWEMHEEKAMPIDSIHNARKTLNFVISVATREHWVGDYRFNISEAKQGNNEIRY